MSSFLDISKIYLEPAVRLHPRGQHILSKFPDVPQEEVASHWNIPALEEENLSNWMKTKRQVLVLGIKKTMKVKDNGRSADFIAPSTSNGCAMACVYCYVARRKSHANPLSLFMNVEDALVCVEKHAQKQGWKFLPNQVDAKDWVYDLGENGDLSVDALLCDGVEQWVRFFRSMPNAKGSFATKFVNLNMLSYDPQGKTRIRFSLMPAAHAKVLDVRTSLVSERLEAMNLFAEAGYEVHVNFSPVVVQEGWLAAWRNLFIEMQETLTPKVKKQLACEIIFLTHNEGLHEANQQWHPKAEALLWRPDIQEKKISQNGQENVRYKAYLKRQYLDSFQQTLQEILPSCRVRYAF